MEETNIQPIIDELNAISDDDLIKGLRENGLYISDEKFHNAFSAYGLSNFLSGTSLATLKANIPIPDLEMNSIRWNGVFMLRGYTAMVYMRSYHLEKGLDNVEETSPIYPFKRFFGQNPGTGEDSIARHIRNSFSHGSFELSSDMQFVIFTDFNWQIKIRTAVFIDDFCGQIFRFYGSAFQAGIGCVC